MDADHLELYPSMNRILRAEDIYLPLYYDQAWISHLKPWVLIILNFAQARIRHLERGYLFTFGLWPSMDWSLKAMDDGRLVLYPSMNQILEAGDTYLFLDFDQAWIGRLEHGCWLPYWCFDSSGSQKCPTIKERHLVQYLVSKELWSDTFQMRWVL